jgi:hypothetical protein
MPTYARDIQILRDLAREYADLAADPVNDERRRLWSAHFSLKRTRVPILVDYGMWNVWCREVFGDDAMRCEDPFLRERERRLRMRVFQASIDDDSILEPWITEPAVHATQAGIYGEAWGAEVRRTEPSLEGGSWKSRPFIEDWDDIRRLTAPAHCIDEEVTARNVERLRDAIGDILAVDVGRNPLLYGFAGDISTTIAQLRGLDQLMLDMYDAPTELHELLAFLRDGILANQEAAERACDFTLTTQHNQAMPYADELEWPWANAGPRPRRAMWGFCAAQEYTLISPEFHDAFLFQYQIPIMQHYGLVHYGCCEDLTRKISMLRQLKNLRSIAVTPRADVWRSAEQIGSDYVISWRPNPTDMVCTGWDEDRIRRLVREGLQASRDGFVHIHLKDIETVQGDVTRLARWTRIVREVSGEV